GVCPRNLCGGPYGSPSPLANRQSTGDKQRREASSWNRDKEGTADRALGSSDQLVRISSPQKRGTCGGSDSRFRFSACRSLDLVESWLPSPGTARPTRLAGIRSAFR